MGRPLSAWSVIVSGLVLNASTASAAEVYCDPQRSGRAQLKRLVDNYPLGEPMSRSVCDAAVRGAHGGVVCTKSIYSDRRGYAPTIVREERGLGYVGVGDINICNRMIEFAEQLIVCSYAGADQGWVPTRTYGVPWEPVRSPHQLGMPYRSLTTCLKVAEQSLMSWTEDGLIHQTCRWNGSGWLATCASNTSINLSRSATSVDECLDAIQIPGDSCQRGFDRELRQIESTIGWDTDITADQDLTVDKLRSFCAACHAVGEQNFLPSGDNAEVWRVITEERATRSGMIWAEGIIEVLSWPSDTPPRNGDLMDPPDRDWMPKGLKRRQLAEDMAEESPTRQFIIETLRAGVEKR